MLRAARELRTISRAALATAPWHEAFTPRIQKVIYTRFYLIWCKNSRNLGFCQVLDLGPPNARNLTITLFCKPLWRHSRVSASRSLEATVGGLG